MKRWDAMMRGWCFVLGCVCLCLAMRVGAQDATPSPTPTPTLMPLTIELDVTPSPAVVPTVAPLLVITQTPLPPVVSDLTFTTYISKDHSFAFDYPSDWTVIEQDYYTSFTAPIEAGEMSFTVFNPRFATILTDGQPDEVSALGSLRQYFDFIPENISATTIQWRKAAIAPLAMGTTGGGVAMLMEMSRGGYGLVFAITNQGQLQGFLPLIDTMIRRYDSPGSRRLATREQLTLNTYAGPRENIIAALSAQKIIKPDVTLLDNVDTLELSGDSSQFRPMAERLPMNSVVMMGEMAFLPKGSAYESCSFVLHVVPAEADDPNQTLRHYLEVGLDQTGTAFYFDAGRDETRTISADMRTGIDLTRPHAFVLLLTNERMTVYLDGINIADNMLVRGVAGTAGLSLRPSSPDTHCLFRNVALYRMTPLPAGLCTITPRQATNTRLTPSTGAAIGALVTPETSMQVVAYLAPSGSRLRWWKLEDASWLREDAVDESGDCENLPLLNDQTGI